MALLDRLVYQVRAKLDALLNRYADPGEELDYSYERMRDELQDVNRGIADLATQRKRLQKHRDRLEEHAANHEEQARVALAQGREDLATRAIEKRRANLDQVADLSEQIEELAATQAGLLERRDELDSRIRRFRTEKETMKARYEAAEASARVTEALTGIGDEMGDVGRAIERATDRTEAMEARAAALDELEETGGLDSVLEEGDSIDRELDRISHERQVDADLATLKADLERETALGAEGSGEDERGQEGEETEAT